MGDASSVDVEDGGQAAVPRERISGHKIVMSPGRSDDRTGNHRGDGGGSGRRGSWRALLASAWRIILQVERAAGALVGRARERGAVDAGVQAARDGAGRVLLVSG